jgi:ribose transport system substrate-binding protein
MAAQAVKELGIPDITIQTPQNWIQNEQNQMLDGMIASGVKGIFMMTSEATAGNEQISKMVDAGIPVVTIGGPPDLPSKSTLTLATDVEQSAYDATMAVIDGMGGKGNLVGLSGSLNDTNTQKRFAGIEKAVNEVPEVELLQLVGDISNAESAMTIVGDLLAARGAEIDGIVAMDYYAAFGVANYMLQSDDYDHISAVGIDSDEKVIEAIRAGKMLGTMSQNPWGQAYIGMYTLKMLVDGWTYKEGQPEVIDSGSYLITQENVEDYEGMVIEGTMAMMEQWTERFNPPTN